MDMVLKAGKIKYKALFILVVAIFSFPSIDLLAKDNLQALKEVHRAYDKEVREGASLEALARYWDLTTLEHLYNVNADDNIKMFEYALRYPEFYQPPQDTLDISPVDDNSACIRVIGNSSDGDGKVAIDIFYMLSEEKGWQANQVHAHFFNEHTVSPNPDCSFREAVHP